MLTGAFSVYLDALRVTAALIVCLYHWAYISCGESLASLQYLNAGTHSVMVFFVLSGLVIADSASRAPSAGQFLFKRWTRFVSVAYPALLVSFLVDLGRLEMETGHPWEGWVQMTGVGSFLSHLTFTNQWLGLNTRFGTNSPYWSLSYEAAYYLLFAIGWYGRGGRRVLMGAVLSILVGPRVLLLAPAWVLGAGLARSLTATPPGSQRGVRPWLAVSLPVFVYGLCWWYRVPRDLTFETARWLEVDMLTMRKALAFSGDFVFCNVVAVLVTCHLWGVAALLAGRDSLPAARLIRWCAGMSFSLYIFHLPLLRAFHRVAHHGDAVWLEWCSLPATFVVCAVFASLTERRLSHLRERLRR